MGLDLAQWWESGGGKYPDLFNPHHVGLYLNRCLPPVRAVSNDLLGIVEKEDAKPDDKDKNNRLLLYRSAVHSLRGGSEAVKTYSVFLNRWIQALKTGGRVRRVFEVEANSRVLLHPNSNGSVTDGSVLSHFTYGTPYLPGSGLKGLARAYGRSLGEALDGPDLKRWSDDCIALFGHERGAGQGESQAGLVSFFDALWVPAGAESPLDIDVVTPHHTSFHSKLDPEPPGDWESPVPTHRLAVRPGARFLIALEAVDGEPTQVEAWLDLAENLVVHSLTEMGFGAWTRSGFGQMSVVGGAKGSRASGAGAAPQRLSARVEVVWNPGKRELSARLPDGKQANTEGPAAEAVLAMLPPELGRRIRNQKKGALVLEVEAVGLSWRIVAAKAP